LLKTWTNDELAFMVNQLSNVCLNYSRHLEEQSQHQTMEKLLKVVLT